MSHTNKVRLQLSALNIFIQNAGSIEMHISTEHGLKCVNRNRAPSFY